jgi:hypothetical protein
MWRWYRDWRQGKARRIKTNGAIARPSHYAIRPRLEALEDRQLLSGATYIAIGSDFGSAPLVKIYNPGGTLLYQFFAYDPNFTGGVRVTLGDVNGDHIPDVITAPGPGGSPDIRVFDGAHLQLATPFGGDMIRHFEAYSPYFTGGVYVAAGDVNHDGVADIVTGAGPGGGPHVEVWNGLTGLLTYSFYAYNRMFTGGVRVAAGNVNNDGFDDIITGAGPGGGPQVNVYNGFDGSLRTAFYAYDRSFTGGVFVASGDMENTGFWDIITGAGVGGSSLVRVFSGIDGHVVASFNAFGSDFTGGVRVASADVSGDGTFDIIVAAGTGAAPEVKVFNIGLSVLLDYLAFLPSNTAGVFVGGA